MERISYLGKYVGTHQELKGLPLAGSTVLPEGETDAARKEAKKASKSASDKGPADAIIYVRVGSSDVAART
jgi:hypothetical protein